MATPNNNGKGKETEKKISKVDIEILKIAITNEYNTHFRKDDKPLNVGNIKWNNLNQLKDKVQGLDGTIKSIVTDDLIGNFSSWKLSNLSEEIAERLNKHFDTKGIDLGLNGKKEQVAKIIVNTINSVYNTEWDKTSKQIKVIDLLDVYNLKGKDLPNLKNLEMTLRPTKAKISDLSEKAINRILDDLKEVA